VKAAVIVSLLLGLLGFGLLAFAAEAEDVNFRTPLRFNFNIRVSLYFDLHLVGVQIWAGWRAVKKIEPIWNNGKANGEQSRGEAPAVGAPCFQ